MSMSMVFMCCCAPTTSGNEESSNAQHVDAVQEVTGDSNQPAAGLLGKTAMPNFPAPVRTPRKDLGAKSLSPREKEQEKARLQEIVKDFSRKAVEGIRVQLVDPESQETNAKMFTMDKYLYTLTLSSEGEDHSTSGRAFNLKDITSIYKGADVAAKVLNLSSLANFVVGVDFARPDIRFFFYFKETGERDKFYTCLKILRMSVDVDNQK